MYVETGSIRAISSVVNVTMVSTWVAISDFICAHSASLAPLYTVKMVKTLHFVVVVGNTQRSNALIHIGTL